MYLNSHYVMNGGGTGRGLAPTRGHLISHVTIPYGITDSWKCAGFILHSPWFYFKVCDRNIIYMCAVVTVGAWGF
jgi:hypothetical protein